MRRLLRELLVSRGTLPAVSVFLPLVARGVAANLGARSPAPAGARALVRRLMTLPERASIVQLPPIDLDTTAALATACWRSERRVLVQWGREELERPERRAAFECWHRSVIALGLLPVLEIVERADPCAPGVGLVSVGDELRPPPRGGP